jgi:Uma2 family endonuclease
MAQRAIPPEAEKNAPEIEAAYAAVPEGAPVKAEILEGVLYMMNRPRTPHQHLAGELHFTLRGAYQRGSEGDDDRWIFLAEPALHLGSRPDKLSPDIVGWHRRRLVGAFDTSAITIAPDWVCEILSESTEENDRERKWRIFRRERVLHYWILDPEQKTLEAHELRDGDYKLIAEHRGDEKVRVAPFDKVEIAMAGLWNW